MTSSSRVTRSSPAFQPPRRTSRRCRSRDLEYLPRVLSSRINRERASPRTNTLPQRERAQGVFARGRPPVCASEEGSERGAAEPSPREARRALRGSAVPLSEPSSLARSRTGRSRPRAEAGPLGERASAPKRGPLGEGIKHLEPHPPPHAPSPPL